MPNRLQKAIGVFKDQTSISLAKVNSSSNIHVLVLKATTHDDLPINERYVSEILSLISSNQINAASCVSAIRKRITRTHNWVVALKSLMLVLRIFQDGDPNFPREVVHASSNGGKLLNLSEFSDYSSSTPWDYTGFIRAFALYLDERLDCLLTEKLDRKHTYNKKVDIRHYRKKTNEYVCDMEPAMLLDKIVYWQRLLKRAIETKPTGVAKYNELVLTSVYPVVRESFDLYRDISDGLTLLLDKVLQLEYQSRVSIDEICVEAEKQFEELNEFYSLCKRIGVGKTVEYPNIQFVSRELIGTLQESLKYETDSGETGEALVLPGVGFSAAAENISDSSSESGSEYKSSYELMSEVIQGVGFSPPIEKVSDKSSESGSEYKSSEELMSVTETQIIPSISVDIEEHVEQSDKMDSIMPLLVTNSELDPMCFDDWPATDEQIVTQEQDQDQEESYLADRQNITQEQESILVDQHSDILLDTYDAFHTITLYNKQQHQPRPLNHYNQFLQDLHDIPVYDSCVAAYWAENQTCHMLIYM
ncbi:clathrin coat assembly protein AP180-like protein [Tanacetum coccineum]